MVSKTWEHLLKIERIPSKTRTRCVQDSVSTVRELAAVEEVLEHRKDVIVRKSISGQDFQHEVKIRSPVRTVFHCLCQNAFNSVQIRTNLVKHESNQHHTVEYMSTAR